LEAFVRARWGRKQGGIRGLASRSGVSAETIYRLFNGVGQPDLATITALADALGVKRHELLAAMDGEGPVATLDDRTREAVRAEIEAVLDERLGPRREARG
jgi:transcriptional regulator with XRE-family HTH domain